jgi:hypothetical protein
LEDLKTYECGWWIDLSKENLAKTLGMAMQKNYRG